MAIEPTNQEVAVEIGIDEVEVERYRREALQLGDGSWLVYFSYEMPKELRHRFAGSFTAIIPNSFSKGDAQREG